MTRQINHIEPPCRLEQVDCDFPNINGIVSVINFGFEKEVFVRYTTNEWETWRDLRCEYSSRLELEHTIISSQQQQQQQPRDEFSFKIQLRKDFEGDGKIWFAIGYRSPQYSADTFWDNNNSSNFLVLCKFQAFIDEKWILCNKKFFSYHQIKD